MCNPAFIPLAITAVSAISGHSAKKTQMESLTLAADMDLAHNTEALTAQRGEINAQAADEMSERAKQAMIERGRLRALAADSGLTGISHERLQNEATFNESSDIAAIEGNRQRSLAQNTRSKRAAVLDAERTKLGISGPSLIGTGLQIAGAAYQAKTPSGKTYTPPVQESVPGQYSTANPQYG